MLRIQRATLRLLALVCLAIALASTTTPTHARVSAHTEKPTPLQNIASGEIAHPANVWTTQKLRLTLKLPRLPITLGLEIVSGVSLTWNSKRLDQTTGFLVYKYRHYSPELGRFISRDPIEEIGGVNLYAFAWNAATTAWDILGMDPRLIRASVSTMNCHDCPQRSGWAGGGAPSIAEDLLEIIIRPYQENVPEPLQTVIEFWVPVDSVEALLEGDYLMVGGEFLLGKVKILKVVPGGDKVVDGACCKVKGIVDWFKKPSKAKGSGKKVEICDAPNAKPSGTQDVGTLSAPGQKVSINGNVNATEISGRMSPQEMAELQKKHSKEFAQIYVTGAGKNGGGGKYYLIEGDGASVPIPVGEKVRLINHTHPKIHPDTGNVVPHKASNEDYKVMKHLKDAGSPQKQSQIVPEEGSPFNFGK